MKGLIKFYNTEKGFGFIVGEDNNEYYFNHRAITYGEMPKSGAHCEFETEQKTRQGKKPQVSSMKIIASEEQSSAKRQDDRVLCPGCNRKIVPRLVTYAGTPDRSLCPYCGTELHDFVPGWKRFLRLFA